MSAAQQVMDGAPLTDSGPFGFVTRNWSGRGSLAAVFWGYGLAGTALQGMLYWLLMAQGNLLGQQILLLILGIYTVWVLGSIWRCAKLCDVNYFHGSARALTVAWAINAVLLGGFLELDLLARFLK